MAFDNAEQEEFEEKTGEVEESIDLETEEEEPKSEEESNDELPEDEDGEVVVTIGDEEPTPEVLEAPEWVRELRKSHREIQRENRELKAKLEASNQPKKIEVGAKPKLEDFEYDTDVYESKLADWYEKKRNADEQAAAAEEQQRAQEQAWQARLSTYGEGKANLKVKDFEDAEAAVLETLNQTQQGIIIQGADNSALVVYALGKNPGKTKELAQINDPVKFAFAVAKLEKDLKVKNRKAPPPPERSVSGTAPKAGLVDSTLDRLRAEAEKTGNYTKVRKYKQQQRQKANR